MDREGCDWAATNLGVATPHELQEQGVNVFFAPNIEPGTSVINLADGDVVQFEPEEERPRSGIQAPLAWLPDQQYETPAEVSKTTGRSE